MRSVYPAWWRGEAVTPRQLDAAEPQGPSQLVAFSPVMSTAIRSRPIVRATLDTPRRGRASRLQPRRHNQIGSRATGIFRTRRSFLATAVRTDHRSRTRDGRVHSFPSVLNRDENHPSVGDARAGKLTQTGPPGVCIRSRPNPTRRARRAAPTTNLSSGVLPATQFNQIGAAFRQ